MRRLHHLAAALAAVLFAAPAADAATFTGAGFTIDIDTSTEELTFTTTPASYTGPFTSVTGFSLFTAPGPTPLFFTSFVLNSGLPAGIASATFFGAGATETTPGSLTVTPTPSGDFGADESSVVPVPAALPLMVAALGALALVRRRA